MQIVSSLFDVGGVGFVIVASSLAANCDFSIMPPKKFYQYIVAVEGNFCLRASRESCAYKR